MAKRSLLWTISPPLFAILALAIALVTGFTGRSVRHFFTQRSVSQLTEQAHLMARDFNPLVQTGDQPGIQALSRDIGPLTGVRFTIIAADGRVLGDSAGRPEAMENHAGRPEVATALSGQIGQSIRYSTTVKNKRLYVAVPAGSETAPYVLRTSISLASITKLSANINRLIALAGLLLFLVVGAGVLLMSRSLGLSLDKLRQRAQLLATGDFRADLAVGGSKEIVAVGESLNHMAEQLQQQFIRIAAERNELKAVMGSMIEGVMAIDRQETVFSLNDAGARMLDTTPDAAMGRTIQEIGRNRHLTSLVQEVLDDGRTRECDIHLTLPEERWVQVHGTMLHHANDRPWGVLLVMNDITRLHHLENIRRDFVANVSHELKTPITAIKGFIETLQEDPPEDPRERERFLSIINNQADRLATIIADLLDLARLEQETDEGTLEKSPSPLAPLLARVIQDATGSTENAAGRITLDCPGDHTVDVNARLIAQAMSNLLTNALSYSSEGSPITVSCTVETDTIRLAVTDQGPGIPADHIPRLCERFYRIDKARSRQLGGTGLGLAIVKHIAQAHGGRLEIKSKPGAGSTFTLVLPHEVSA